MVILYPVPVYSLILHLVLNSFKNPLYIIIVTKPFPVQIKTMWVFFKTSKNHIIRHPKNDLTVIKNFNFFQFTKIRKRRFRQYLSVEILYSSLIKKMNGRNYCNFVIFMNYLCFSYPTCKTWCRTRQSSWIMCLQSMQVS